MYLRNIYRRRYIYYLKDLYSFIAVHSLDFYHAYAHGEGDSIN